MLHWKIRLALLLTSLATVAHGWRGRVEGGRLPLVVRSPSMRPSDSLGCGVEQPGKRRTVSSRARPSGSFPSSCRSRSRGFAAVVAAIWHSSLTPAVGLASPAWRAPRRGDLRRGVPGPGREPSRRARLARGDLHSRRRDDLRLAGRDRRRPPDARDARDRRAPAARAAALQRRALRARGRRGRRGDLAVREPRARARCSLLEVVLGGRRVLRRQHSAVAAIMARWSREPFLPLLRDVGDVDGRLVRDHGLGQPGAQGALWTQSPVLAAALAGPARRRRAPPALDPRRAARDAARAHRPADRPRQPPPLPGAAPALCRARRPRRARRSASACSTSTTSSRSTTATAIPRATRCSRRSRRGSATRGQRLPARRRRVRARPARLRRAGGARARREARPRRSAPTRPSTAAPSASPPASRRSRSTARDRAELVRVADIVALLGEGRGQESRPALPPDRPVAQHLQQLATGPDRGARLQAAAALAGAVDARDAYVGSHSERVGELAAALRGALRPAAGAGRADPRSRGGCTTSARSRSRRRSCASAAR